MKIRIYLALRPLAVVAAVLLAAPGAHGETEGVTPGWVVRSGQPHAKALRELAVELGEAEGRVAVDLAEQLDTALTEFSSGLGDKLGTPLSELSAKVRASSREIQIAIEHLEGVLDHQRQCGTLRSNILVGALATIHKRLANAAEFKGPTAPRPHFFRFDGHRASIVPEEGQALTIGGFRLWPKEDYPPIVSVMNSNRSRELAKLTPTRGPHEHMFTTNISRDLLRKHTGSCLWIKMTIRDADIGFLTTTEIPLGDLYLPMCIPALPSQAPTLTLDAEVEYTCGGTTKRNADPLRFRFENESCDDAKTVKATKGAAIPKGCKIIGASAVSDAGATADPGSKFTFSGTTVTAHGTVGKADCFKLAFIKRRRASTVWSYTVLPRLECSSEVTTKTKASSDPLTLRAGKHTLCARVERGCDFPTSKASFSISMSSSRLAAEDAAFADAFSDGDDTAPPKRATQKEAAGDASKKDDSKKDAPKKESAAKDADSKKAGEARKAERESEPGSPVTLFTSEKLRAQNTPLEFEPGALGAWTVESNYAPKTADGSAQVCAQVRIPSCNY